MMGDLPNGEEDRLCSGLVQMAVSSAAANPDPESVGAESWNAAEVAAREVIDAIHPTAYAHWKRTGVVDYVNRLFKSSLGIQVFPYGSVPLKTYLPDGDIDLTAISSPALEDAMVSDVYAVLKGEEHNEDAPYEVKDVHHIDAEVKLIKCIVQNVVVDISFNQTGGLYTLCFLEQIDRLVGKFHLFKRSIILIKAWCYYESRILGAYHGLISTYALETLVLYIFNQFHSSLHGPLSVLYRFLDYFSKFDWDNYCVSLNGPVSKSALPDIVVPLLKKERGELLLSDDFLKKCAEEFSSSSTKLEINSRAFPQKYLNIIDPLKENNNLGRSVNRGNFFRIRSAFKHGARKLGQVLLLPQDKIANELNKFFENTLDRHRASENPVSPSLSLQCKDNGVFKLTAGQYNDRGLGVSGLAKSHNCPPLGSSGICKEDGKIENGTSCREKLRDFATVDGTSCSLESERKENSSNILDSARSCNHEGLGSLDSANSGLADYSVISDSVCSCTSHVGTVSIGSVNSIPVNYASENFLFGERNLAGISKSFLDLNGDYNSHVRSVKYARNFHLNGASVHPLSGAHILPQLNTSHWGTARQSLQLKQNVHSQMNTNTILGQQPYTANQAAPFYAASNYEEKEKRRGTGTYIPNMSYHSNRDRFSPRRGRNLVTGIHGPLHKHSNANGLATSPKATNSSEHSHEISEAEYPPLGNGKPKSSVPQQSHQHGCGSSNANGSLHTLEEVDSRSQSLNAREGAQPETMDWPDLSASYPQASASRTVMRTGQSPKPTLENEEERDTQQSYHLKDEAEFPPLSC